MSVADEVDPYSSLYAWLAFDLRFYRHKRGLTGTQLGKIIGCVRSHVANLEAGRARIDMRQAKALDDTWDTGGHFQRLLWFARTAHDPDWFRQSAEIEAIARILRIYQGQIIPVPLQTEAYARAVLTTARSGDIEQMLAQRMERQAAILERKDPPLLVALLDQDALDRPVDGDRIMTGQLQRLLDLGERGNVIVRVICAVDWVALRAERPVPDHEPGASGCRLHWRVPGWSSRPRSCRDPGDSRRFRVDWGEGVVRGRHPSPDQTAHGGTHVMLHWRRSSHSGSANDEMCVELAGLPDGVGVRDSKDPDGGRLALSGVEFAGFVNRIKRGALDRTS